MLCRLYVTMKDVNSGDKTINNTKTGWFLYEFKLKDMKKYNKNCR